MKIVRYAVEYKAPIARHEWWETQEVEDLMRAEEIEKALHDKGLVARTIKRTTIEEYVA